MATFSAASIQAQMAEYKPARVPQVQPQAVHHRCLDRQDRLRSAREAYLDPQRSVSRRQQELQAHRQVLVQLLRSRRLMSMAFSGVQMLDYWALYSGLYSREFLRQVASSSHSFAQIFQLLNTKSVPVRDCLLSSKLNCL